MPQTTTYDPYSYGGGGGGGFNYGYGRGGGGGGGGGGPGGSQLGGAGTDGLGGGGGGAKGQQFSNPTGGEGGDGLIVLSIPTSSYSGVTTGSPTVTTSGGNTIVKYTSTGTYKA